MFLWTSRVCCSCPDSPTDLLVWGCSITVWRYPLVKTVTLDCPEPNHSDFPIQFDFFFFFYAFELICLIFSYLQQLTTLRTFSAHAIEVSQQPNSGSQPKLFRFEPSTKAESRCWVVLAVTCAAQAIRMPDLNSANKDCQQRVFRHQQVEGNLCHVDLWNAPGIADKMKMNPW